MDISDVTCCIVFYEKIQYKAVHVRIAVVTYLSYLSFSKLYRLAVLRL
jgi:hypothetical protein